MAIELITYAGKTITPMRDAIVHDGGDGSSGILYGCGITANGNVLSIAAGYGIIKGRLFQVSSTNVSVTLSSGSNLLGRIFVRLDLSNSETPISIESETGSTLSDLTQEDDCNYTDGIWEMELATFTVTTSSITNLIETFTNPNRLGAQLKGNLLYSGNLAPSSTGWTLTTLDLPAVSNYNIIVMRCLLKYTDTNLIYLRNSGSVTGYYTQQLSDHDGNAWTRALFNVNFNDGKIGVACINGTPSDCRIMQVSGLAAI